MAEKSAESNRALGWAWVALCLAFCAHVADEASTHFLSVYNSTVTALRERFSWFPMPTFEFGDWLTGIGHTVGTIAGRTVESVHFARPMPGFWSSPLLLATSIYMLYRLRK